VRVDIVQVWMQCKGGVLCEGGYCTRVDAV
jgi:hypothetical protein